MRLCPSCQEQKGDSHFHKSSRAKSGLQTYCKACHIEKDNENPARNERYLRYRAKWPGRTTWSFIKKRAEKFGVPISPMEHFVGWLEQASRHCVYCGMEEAEAKTKFDHNLHIDRKDGTLGYVVGNMVLACHRCNVVKNAYLTHDQMMQVAGMFFGGPVNNHDALLEFFRWAMREGPWDGGDIDGGSVQDKAEALGLIVKTQYDAEKHGVQSDFETGDDWFEYAPDLRPSAPVGISGGQGERS